MSNSASEHCRVLTDKIDPRLKLSVRAYCRSHTSKLSFFSTEVMLTSLIREKMKIPANVVDQLITGSQSDIRQVLNMLSTWRLSSSSMDFDEAKNLYVYSSSPAVH